MKLFLLALALPFLLPVQDPPSEEPEPWVVYEPEEGLANGKHVVLIAGDEEYRSEEALPMLGRILARRHGFKCTVLFSTDPETGEVDPKNQTHIPGMRHLEGADMAVVFLRFRELPDEDMRHFVDFVESGKPILGLRTATHAFDYTRDKESPYFHYTWRNPKWPGGFGKQILGETWVAHHGGHGSESTRGVPNPVAAEHPVLRGVTDVWGPTDVYTARPPEDAAVLLFGQVLAGMTPDAQPVGGPKNEPMMPIAWAREMPLEAGGARRVVCSTIGASTDMESAGLRRLLVNACYWGMRMEVPEEADVAYVGEYAPTTFGFGKFQAGVRPADLRLTD